MNVEKIIQQWYLLSSGENIDSGDVFFRFVSVWVDFNALYASRFSDVEGDKQQVLRFAQEFRANGTHLHLIRDDPQYRDAVDLLKQSGVYDTRTYRRRFIGQVDDLSGVMHCLYQVRNNLFYGGKMPENSRDENVVETSFIVLSKLIRPYLPEAALPSWAVNAWCMFCWMRHCPRICLACGGWWNTTLLVQSLFSKVPIERLDVTVLCVWLDEVQSHAGLFSLHIELFAVEI